MSVLEVLDDVKGYLKLTSRVVSKVGSIINVGEKFTLRFSGSNIAYDSVIHSRARIVFNNARIFVKGTSYARPVGGDNWHNLPDTKLYPGESSYLDIEFEATADIPGYLDNYLLENVAIAWIFADLDPDRFFLMMNKMYVYEEVEPT